MLLAADDAADAAASVWLHELAHVTSRGERPHTRSARRIVAAVSEGVADYVAAAALADPTIGDASTQRRDLRAPPRVRPGQWEAVVFDGVRFDVHEHGWRLAAELWTRRVDPGDAVRCLADAHFARGATTVASELRPWLDGCAPAFAEAVRAWLPDELE